MKFPFFFLFFPLFWIKDILKTKKEDKTKKINILKAMGVFHKYKRIKELKRAKIKEPFFLQLGI